MTIERNDILAVIPTYNNEKTLARVIGEVRRYCTDVLVVNDGSTDSTAGIIAGAGVGSISYAPNRGKGYALRRALRYAAEHGYRYMLTIDSDGQHSPRTSRNSSKRSQRPPTHCSWGHAT